MAVTVTSNFSVGDVKFTNAEIMREVGLLARELIVRRTSRGVDANGVPFQPYSPAYAKQKLLGLGKASPVNLQASGAMLNALRVVEVTAKTVTLGFA